MTAGTVRRCPVESKGRTHLAGHDLGAIVFGAGLTFPFEELQLAGNDCSVSFAQRSSDVLSLLSEHCCAMPDRVAVVFPLPCCFVVAAVLDLQGESAEGMPLFGLTEFWAVDKLAFDSDRN
jgi:hypothetical protein